MGSHKIRSGGEEHRYNPQTIHMLQQSTRTGDYDMFKQYTAMVDEEQSGISEKSDGLSIIRKTVFRSTKWKAWMRS